MLYRELIIKAFGEGGVARFELECGNSRGILSALDTDIMKNRMVLQAYLMSRDGSNVQDRIYHACDYDNSAFGVASLHEKLYGGFPNGSKLR